MTEGLQARPPTRDEIAHIIFLSRNHQDPSAAAANALLAEFSIVARVDTPPASAGMSASKLREMALVIDSVEHAANNGWGKPPDPRLQEVVDTLITWAAALESRPRGVTPDPQGAASADEAFEAWCEQNGVFEEPFFQEMRRKAFMAAWNARAAVGVSPPTDTHRDEGNG